MTGGSVNRVQWIALEAWRTQRIWWGWSGTWTDEQKLLRDGLRRSLAMARMTRFRIDMSHAEYVASLGVVTKLELGLITWFGESVPDPNANWDSSRRWLETERRIARLRWVSEEEAKEYSGIKGILNRITGRKKITGKDLFQSMVAEADWMIRAMRDGGSDTDMVSEVVRQVGLTGEAPGAPRSVLGGGRRALPK